MAVLHKPDFLDYLEFFWNLACCVVVSALALIPISFAAVCIYAAIGCRIVDLFR